MTLRPPGVERGSGGLARRIDCCQDARMLRGGAFARASISIFVAVAVAGGLAACTGGGSGGSASNEGGGTDAARSAIEATDISKPETIGALERIRFTNAGTQAARGVLQAGAEGDALWGATYVYATSGTDPAPLVPLLQNEDATIRVMAAAALVSLGEPAGFDALVKAVSLDEPLRGSLPPESVSGFATFTLTRYTGVDLGRTEHASAADIETVAAKWTTWLEQHRDGLRFDAASGMWATS